MRLFADRGLATVEMARVDNAIAAQRSLDRVLFGDDRVMVRFSSPEAPMPIPTSLARAANQDAGLNASVPQRPDGRGDRPMDGRSNGSYPPISRPSVHATPSAVGAPLPPLLSRPQQPQPLHDSGGKDSMFPSRELQPPSAGSQYGGVRMVGEPGGRGIERGRWDEEERLRGVGVGGLPERQSFRFEDPRFGPPTFSPVRDDGSGMGRDREKGRERERERDERGRERGWDISYGDERRGVEGDGRMGRLEHERVGGMEVERMAGGYDRDRRWEVTRGGDEGERERQYERERVGAKRVGASPERDRPLPERSRMGYPPDSLSDRAPHLLPPHYDPKRQRLELANSLTQMAPPPRADEPRLRDRVRVHDGLPLPSHEQNSREGGDYGYGGGAEGHGGKDEGERGGRGSRWDREREGGAMAVAGGRGGGGGGGGAVAGGEGVTWHGWLAKGGANMCRVAGVAVGKGINVPL